jgi:hypothetical protein
MRHCLLISLFLVSQTSFAQNLIFQGKKSYKSTPTYEFKCGACSLSQGEILSVSFAKSSTGGIILLSINTPAGMRIGGTVLLYLADGSIISCVDKGTKDRVNEQSRALYYLTPSQFATIAHANILKIRFAIRGNAGNGLYETGSYTVSNPELSILDNVYSANPLENRHKYNISAGISNLN